MKKYAVDICRDIDINGDRQNIRIRAAREGLPPILFIHGGPGVCDRHIVLAKQSALAEKYTMVCWDQRGSGKSYSPGIKKQELTVDTYVEDARELVSQICRMLGADKVVIAGHSWGTVIGLQLVSRYPEKIAAYIGQGQFIDGWKNEEESYRFCVREAERLGDKKAMRALSGIAPTEGRYPSDKAMMTQRNYLSRFGGGNYKERHGMFRSLLIPLLKSDEYSLGDVVRYAKGALYLSKALWNGVVALHLGDTINKLSVPVIITQGDHDYNTPTSIVEAWFKTLEAPYKKWISFHESAHSPIAEESEKWGREVESALGEALASV